MKLTIAVNSDPAQKEIHSLREENNKLNESIDVLKQKKDELGRRNKANAQEWDALTKEIQKSTTEIGLNNKKIEELRASMDITQMTVGQLKKELALLNQMKVNVLPGSEAAQKLNEQIGAINTRLREVSGGANESRKSFSALADKFNHYSGLITAGAAALVGFGITVQNIIDRNNKMADAMSGVEKTTNMTRQEVERLTKAFSDFDTRTSKIDLLKIAEEGGRLGVAKSQIADFVKEVDKANVALGDSWSGGASKVAESLGKITTLYDSTKSLPIAQSINEVGSALNELAANGASSEANIADFTTRVGAMPSALKPAIGDVMGIGAALEESGIDAERGATAFSNFMTTAAKNTAKFAEVMRVPEKQVKDLINSNPTEFFLKFSEGLKGLDATELASIFEHLKLNDQYVKSVLGAASDNTARFRDQIDLANQSIKEGTSLQNEFDKVNNNAAATWEKLQKKISGFFTSEFIAKGLDKLITGFSLFVGVSKDAESKLGAFGKTVLDFTRVLSFLISLVISYNLAIAVYNTLMKETLLRTLAVEAAQRAMAATTAISNGLITIFRASIWLLGAGYSFLTGNTVAANFAMKGFSATLAANPIGAVLTVVTLLSSAFYILKKRNDEATEAAKIHYEKLHQYQTMQKENLQSGKDAVEKYKNSVDGLIGVIKDENATQELRKRAYEQLIKIHPEFMNTVDKEYRATQSLVQVYSDLARQVEITAIAKARASAKQSIYQENEKLKIDYIKGSANRQKEQDDRNELRKKYSYDKERGNSAVYMFGSFAEHNKGVEVLNKLAANNALLNKINGEEKKRVTEITELLKTAKGAKKKELEAELNGYLGIENSIDASGNGNYKKDFGGDDAGKKDEAKTARDKKREAEKWKDIMDQRVKDGETAEQLARQIELDIEDAKIEAMNEGFEKELAALNLQEQRRLAEIDKKKVQQSSFGKIDEQIAKAKGDDKLFFEELRASWEANNAELELLKISRAEVFAKKKETLDYKYKTEEFKKSQEAHQSELGELQRQYNEEFAQYENLEALKAGLKDRLKSNEITQIKTWEDGKQALQKVYHQQELQAQIAHMQSLLAMYQQVEKDMSSTLTPEQRKEVLKFIDEAKNKLAELNATKKGEDKKGEKSIEDKLGKGDADLLGFTRDDWESLYANIQNGTDMLGSMKMAISALSSAFSTYYAYVEANEKKQLATYQKNTDSKKKRLKNQLDTGVINQETYKRETLKLDQELDKKKAELEVKAAKRQRAMQISQAIAGTAMAIINAANTQPFMPLGLAMMVVAGAMGALQIATIASAPLPESTGYEEGFNTMGDEYPIQRQQDGKRFNVRRRGLRSGLVDRPTHFIAGENGVEMVIDSPTWTSYSPELKSAIYSANARAKGFESGFNTVPEKTPTSGNNDEVILKMMNVLGEYTSVMKDIKENGLAAYFVKSARNGKEMQDMLDENQKLINKNKH